jgi:hypothetical protein
MLDSFWGVIYYELGLAQWILEKLNYYEVLWGASLVIENFFGIKNIH